MIPQHFSQQRYWRVSITLGLAMLGYRLISLYLNEPGFYFDEAYYYGWSLTPDWGYYSKPPMVAWLIGLTTQLLGTSEFTTKLSAAVLYALTAWVIQYTAQQVSSVKVGFYAFCIFICMPLVTLNSWFITTDAPLLFFWALTSLFFIKAEQTDLLHHWLLAGLFGGLGLLSKYTMILLPFSVFCMYLFSGQFKKLIYWKFWLTIIVALVVFSPNIVWQFQNGFPSFIHTAELANNPNWKGNPVEFLTGQLAVIGPIALLMLITTLLGDHRKQYPQLWFLTWVPLLIFSAKSFQGEAYINWVAFAYVPGSILAAIALEKANNKLLVAHWALSLVLAFGFYHYQAIQKLLDIEANKNNTPFARIEGYRELSLQVSALAEQYPGAYVGSADRTINAYLSYYLPNSNNRVRTINPDTHVANHYELFYDLNSSERPLIWLSEKPLTILPISQQPAKDYLIAEISQPVYANLTRKLWAYGPIN